jgi:hypothetical protein
MPRFVLNLHAQRQAHRREISFEDVDYVLANYDARHPARRVPGRPPSEFFVAQVRGNRLRVYVEVGSEPMMVTTVAWEER